MKGTWSSTYPKEQNSKKDSHFTRVNIRNLKASKASSCSMDKTATNTASNTEEDVLSTTDSPTLDPTIVDSTEVGNLDTILAQNTSDNTGETDMNNTINSHEVNVVEAAENASIISNMEPSERPKRSAKPSQKHIENRLQFDEAKLDKLW